MPASSPAAAKNEDELPDFDEDEPVPAGKDKEGQARSRDGGTAAVTASGFKDFLLRPELIRAITDCGFEHPSEVQHACVPQAVLGNDILCQAKSGMGKTAVFVLACLQSLSDLEEKGVRVLVLCHTHELAYQIGQEFMRIGAHMQGLEIKAVYGGVPISKDKEMLAKSAPHILVGTPGRVLQLLQGGEKAPLKLEKMTHFILDECDRCIDTLDMRKDVQSIFLKTPKKKQVMMFSATMSVETRGICKKFMHDPHEITVESEAKLTLHGLLQYYKKAEEKTKIRLLIDVLDALEFNQVVIFVSSVKRALALDGVLQNNKFPSMTIHALPKAFEHKVKPGQTPGAKDTRIDRLKMFKDFKKRILVATDLFGRGMDVERVNIVINFDMPKDSDTYLHRVGRAGRFGTKGLAISFVGSGEDEKVMAEVQSRFEMSMEEMPARIDVTSYLNA